MYMCEGQKPENLNMLSISVKFCGILETKAYQ